MKKVKFKGIISTVLIMSALYSICTGLVLYFLDYGMWLGFTRKFIKDTHALSALLMGICILIHFFLNWSLYKREVKTLFRNDSGGL